MSLRMRQARSQPGADGPACDKPLVPAAQTAPGLVALPVTRCQEPGQRFPAEGQRDRAIGARVTQCSCGEQQSIISEAQRDEQLEGGQERCSPGQRAARQRWICWKAFREGDGTAGMTHWLSVWREGWGRICERDEEMGVCHTFGMEVSFLRATGVAGTFAGTFGS